MKRLIKLTTLFLLILSFPLSAQNRLRTYEGKLYSVIYSEDYEQPLQVTYKVLCSDGDVSRSGMDFWIPDGWNTSDNDDYKNNVWDKGHMAPAADFNCFDKETLKETFNYLNCALQHEGLNRGPWKELERFERDLSKIFEEVTVKIIIHFDNEPQYSEGGALIPSGFTKNIYVGEHHWSFKFPNQDVKGIDWMNFRVY